VNVVGNGVVTPTSGSYISGTVVPITATADVGSTFAGWSGDLSGAENPVSLTIDDDKVITATFHALPAVTLSTESTLVQYSDGIEPITLTVTDIDSSGTMLALSAVHWTADGVTFNDGLPGQLALSAPISNGLTLPGVVTYTLSGFIDQPAGTYTVTLTPRDEALVGSPATLVLTVLPEETMFRFRGNRRAVQVAAAGDKTSGPFELAVDVKERYPDIGVEVLPGDLTKANVSLQLVPTGPGDAVDPVADSCSAEFHDVDYDERLIFTCGFDGVPLNTYAVAVTARGGYYAGYDEDVVTVYDPSLGFTNGGGAFDWPGSTDETSFGFSIEYNRNGKNVKGRLLLTRRLADGAVYQLKSNSLDGLALGAEGSYTWTTFSGKATYQGPDMASPEGNYTFIAYAEDHGESGDRFWLQVKDKTGSVVAELSFDEAAAAHAMLISDGDITVPGMTASAVNEAYPLYLPLINNDAQVAQGSSMAQRAPDEPAYRILLPTIARD